MPSPRHTQLPWAPARHHTKPPTPRGARARRCLGVWVGGRWALPAQAQASPRSAAVCSLLLPGPGRAARRLAELALRDRPIKNSVPETLIFALKFSSKYSPAGVCHTPLLRGACVRVCGGSGSGRSPHTLRLLAGAGSGGGPGAHEAFPSLLPEGPRPAEPAPARPQPSAAVCAGRSCWWPSREVMSGPSGPAGGTKVDSGRRDEPAAGARGGRAARGPPPPAVLGRSLCTPPPRPGPDAVHGQLAVGGSVRLSRPSGGRVPSCPFEASLCDPGPFHSGDVHSLSAAPACPAAPPLPSGGRERSSVPAPPPTAPAPGGAGDPLPPPPRAERQAEWDVPSGGSRAD